MSISIEPCGPADAFNVATVNNTAWNADWHWHYRWENPSLTSLIEQSAKRFPWLLMLERRQKRHQKAVDVATGEVVGYVRWLLPHEMLSDEEEDIWSDALVAEPEVEDRERLRKGFEESPLPNTKSMEMLKFRTLGLQEAEERVKVDGPFLVVDFLAVKPTFQRRGIASLLIQKGCEIADAHQMKAFVMSSSAGLKVYERSGFKLVETVSTDYSQFGATEPNVHHFLVRRPLLSQTQPFNDST